MRLRYANYYGYDKENYDDCIDMIRQTNIKHVAILNRWFLIINVFFLVFSLLNTFGVRSSMTGFYLVFLAILTLVGNLTADILYAVVDPRVRIA